MMSRRFRTFAAFLAAFGMLFAQLAVAAYACDRMLQPAAAIAPTEGADCCDRSGDDRADGALCHAHCFPSAQNLEKPSTQPAPAIAAAAIRVLPPSAAGAILAPPTLPSLLARDTAPPVSVRHCCLRI